MVQLDGGIGIHSLLQAKQSVGHTVHLSHGEVHPSQRLVPEVLPQLLPVRGHLETMPTPGGVELDKGVASPTEGIVSEE